MCTAGICKDDVQLRLRNLYTLGGHAQMQSVPTSVTTRQQRPSACDRQAMHELLPVRRGLLPRARHGALERLTLA